MARTTDSDLNTHATPNRLLDQPAPTTPTQVWVGDITYLPEQSSGWLYLVTWLDRYAHRIVGWDVRESMLKALRKALAARQPATGLVVYSN